MKKLLMYIRYSIMSKRTLVLKTNREDFSQEEIEIIGAVLLRKFKTQEELELMCEELLGAI